MDRRAFFGTLALTIIPLPGAAAGQPTRGVARIGILSSGEETSDLAGREPRSTRVQALLRGLSQLGYVYGRDFVTEARGGQGDPKRYPTLVAELVRARVDLIVVGGPAVSAAKQATSTIPVVMVGGALDPVAEGFVRSLSRPGGNITGLSLQQVDAVGKRLELLKQLVPAASLVSVLWEKTSRASWEAAQLAGRERGWKLLSIEVQDAADIEPAFRTATKAGATAVAVLSGAVLFGHHRRVVEAAAASRLPAMYTLKPFVEAGGLASYAADLDDLYRRAAVFVDKILKGAKPADLPVEQPTKFELVINLRTASALDLKVPESLLLRADEVIR
jgi:putative ABC transport system substrate-binding protein